MSPELTFDAGATDPGGSGIGGFSTDSAVLAQLSQSLDELSAATIERIRHDLESYADIDAASLTASVDRNLRTAMTALRTRRAPAPDTLAEAVQTARERFDAGVPVEEIIRAFRISISLIHERFVDLSVSGGVPVQDVVTGSRLLWAVGDAFTTRIVTAYHALEVEHAVHDAQRRLQVTRALLTGQPVDDPLTRTIDPLADYAAVRVETPADHDPDALRRALERTGSLPGRPALVVVDDRICFGLVATRPSASGVPVGLGPFGPLAELAESAIVARQCFRVARHLNLTGVHTMDDLGWRIAAASHPGLWRVYAGRYLDPLRDQGPFAKEVIAAVRAWLTAGRSVPRAAEALVLHPNTVRYRLRRFAELTGADLDDADTIVGVLWAVEFGDPTGFEL